MFQPWNEGEMVPDEVDVPHLLRLEFFPASPARNDILLSDCSRANRVQI